MKSPILFHKHQIQFSFRNATHIRSWIISAIKKEKRKPGTINFIFCTDKYLLTLNKKYLRHNTLTDIITFDFSEKNLISGDIYISINRIKENAVMFKTSFNDEINRVIIHGILHLCGYTDKTKSKKKEMKIREDYYLSLRKF